MMGIPELFFYFFTLMVIGIGCVVAFSKNLLRSAFALFFVLFGVAGFYVLLGADFLAIVQIMVYAGGVNVLLIFGTMLTADISTPKTSNLSFQGALTVVAGVTLFVILAVIINSGNWPTYVPGEMMATTKDLGRLLLKEYVLPFEVVSFLLLASIISAIVLVQRGD